MYPGPDGPNARLPRILLYHLRGAFAHNPPWPAGASQPITFAEALQRARQYGLELQTANIAALLAREDRIQAKAAFLPQTQQVDQFIYTQPNGTLSGIFVPNDGPHVYYVYAQAHEDWSPAKRAEYHRTLAAEALAQAKADMAARGLFATVVQDYYGLADRPAQTRATPSRACATRGRFRTSRKSRNKAAKRRTPTSSKRNCKPSSANATSPTRSSPSTKRASSWPCCCSRTSSKISRWWTIWNKRRRSGLWTKCKPRRSPKSPELRAAQASVRQEEAGVSAARAAYLPALSFDYFYGIQANQLAIYNREHLNNLGSVAQAGMTIPLWNWGATQSKVRQAQLRQQQAKLELSLAQRQLLANLNSSYREAQLAQTQLDSLRGSLDLSRESLRLTNLRYQAGEATALEVVDAQSTLAAARNALDDGLSRYRVGHRRLSKL